MRICSGTDNKFKQGRFWIYLTKAYEKSIGVEWTFRPWDIFTCNVTADGGEGDWTFNFWFIFEFWISLHGIIKWYPKEWNSSTNGGKGGYINSGERKIGISQWDWTITFYFWHDGKNSWYPDKDFKIWYKYINFYDIITGGHRYKSIEEKDYTDYIDLPEKRYEVTVVYRHWHKTYKRFYCKPFQTKGKSIRIDESDITYPSRKYTQIDKDHGVNPVELERKMERKWYSLKSEQNVNLALQMYKDEVLKLRSVESVQWVPFEYRKNFNREEKLKRVLNVC